MTVQYGKSITLKLAQALLFGASLISSIASAQSVDKIKSDLQRQLGANAEIKSVSASVIPGLYEVVINNSLVYTDAQARYMIQGEMVDLKSGANLTEIRQNELNRIRWSDLPLQNAIKMVKGNGSRKLAVFADPNCGYCKRLEKTLADMDNITVYTFLIPILSPDSTVKSKQIWCSSDAATAWSGWMINGTAPSGKTDCANPLDKNLALSKSMNVSGTPAIFFIDGSRIPGAASRDVLEKKLNAMSAAGK